MPEFLSPLLAAAMAEGTVFLCFGVALAGFIRGFSGFGTALIYLPFAAQILTPFEALTTLIIMDLIGPLPLVPQMWRDSHRRDVLRLAGGMALMLPLGLYILSLIAPEIFRYLISGVTLVLLFLLISEVRYPGELKKYMIWMAGGLGGFLAGVAGIPGPPVILLYMASQHTVSVVRANIFLYLLLTDILMLGVLWLYGELIPSAIWLGLVIAPVYLLANVVGAAIFKPEFERGYRILAYIVIGGAAISGLPLWD
ncbi:MAG: TSUP family transporter [Halocynthiibacter sp.]